MPALICFSYHHSRWRSCGLTFALSRAPRRHLTTDSRRDGSSALLAPIDGMASWVQVVTQVNPVRHFVAISRAVLVKGAHGNRATVPHSRRHGGGPADVCRSSAPQSRSFRSPVAVRPRVESAA